MRPQMQMPLSLSLLMRSRPVWHTLHKVEGTRVIMVLQPFVWRVNIVDTLDKHAYVCVCSTLHAEVTDVT